MKKFLLRLAYQILKFLIVTFTIQLAGAIILIPVAYFYDIGRLPRILRWFDSADPYVGRDTSVIESINKGTSSYYPHEGKEVSRWQLTWDKYLWLAWRNPINYFGYKYLGFNRNNSGVVLEQIQIPSIPLTGREIGDSPSKVSGFFYKELMINSRIYYEYYWIYKYSLFGNMKCIRFRMGWKLGQNIVKKNEYVQEVFVFSPFHSYSGI